MRLPAILGWYRLQLLQRCEQSNSRTVRGLRMPDAKSSAVLQRPPQSLPQTPARPRPRTGRRTRVALV